MRTTSNLSAFVSKAPGAAIAFVWFAVLSAPALLTAQQSYQPYPYPASPNGVASSPYAQPSPQSSYAPPQDEQPPYQQPQYQQPQVQQPQMPSQPSPEESYATPYPDQQLSQPAAPPQALSADQLE